MQGPCLSDLCPSAPRAAGGRRDACTCMGCARENPQVAQEKQAELAASVPEASLAIRFSFNVFC